MPDFSYEILLLSSLAIQPTLELLALTPNTFQYRTRADTNMPWWRPPLFYTAQRNNQCIVISAIG